MSGYFGQWHLQRAEAELRRLLQSHGVLPVSWTKKPTDSRYFYGIYLGLKEGSCILALGLMVLFVVDGYLDSSGKRLPLREI